MSRRSRQLLVVALLASTLFGCGRESAAEGEGRGVVRGIASDGSQITLEHGAIPGLMSAMTMDFALAEPRLAAGVSVGDAVAFRVRYADGAYTVTELARASSP